MLPELALVALRVEINGLARLVRAHAANERDLTHVQVLEGGVAGQVCARLEFIELGAAAHSEKVVAWDDGVVFDEDPGPHRVSRSVLPMLGPRAFELLHRLVELRAVRADVVGVVGDMAHKSIEMRVVLDEEAVQNDKVEEVTHPFGGVRLELAGLPTARRVLEARQGLEDVHGHHVHQVIRRRRVALLEDVVEGDDRTRGPEVTRDEEHVKPVCVFDTQLPQFLIAAAHCLNVGAVSERLVVVLLQVPDHLRELRRGLIPLQLLLLRLGVGNLLGADAETMPWARGRGSVWREETWQGAIRARRWGTGRDTSYLYAIPITVLLDQPNGWPM